MWGCRRVALLLIVSSVPGCGGAQGAQGARQDGNRPEGGAEQITSEAPAIGLAAAFSVFRRRQRRSDRLSRSALLRLVTSPSRQPGEDASQARRSTQADGSIAYIWPMARGVCFAFDGGGTCAPLRTLAARGGEVVIGQRSGDRTWNVRLGALVADGVSRVQIRLADGKVRSCRVVESFCLRSYQQPVRQVTWSFRGRTISQVLPRLTR